MNQPSMSETRASATTSDPRWLSIVNRDRTVPDDSMTRDRNGEFVCAARLCGVYRVNMRHGVSRLCSGKRHIMGLIFHDAS
jgi:hypothetical protein